jgi:hypothetical protein
MMTASRDGGGRSGWAVAGAVTAATISSARPRYLCQTILGSLDAFEKLTHVGDALGDEPIQRWDKRGAVVSFADGPFRPRDAQHVT